MNKSDFCNSISFPKFVSLLLVKTLQMKIGIICKLNIADIWFHPSIIWSISFAKFSLFLKNCNYDLLKILDFIQIRMQDPSHNHVRHRFSQFGYFSTFRMNFWPPCWKISSAASPVLDVRLDHPPFPFKSSKTAPVF